MFAQEKVCSVPCSAEGGVCVNGTTCICSSGFSGDDCSASRSSAGLSTGAIAGITIAAVVGGVLIAMAVALSLKYKQLRHERDFNQQTKTESLARLRLHGSEVIEV